MSPNSSRVPPPFGMGSKQSPSSIEGRSEGEDTSPRIPPRKRYSSSFGHRYAAAGGGGGSVGSTGSGERVEVSLTSLVLYFVLRIAHVTPSFHISSINRIEQSAYNVPPAHAECLFPRPTHRRRRDIYLCAGYRRTETTQLATPTPTARISVHIYPGAARRALFSHGQLHGFSGSDTYARSRSRRTFTTHAGDVPRESGGSWWRTEERE